MNWISPTGFNPRAAMPTHRPAISASASGVSMTRSRPKRCWSPTVARKTPPLTPMSSPSSTTLGSSPSARASATLIASTSVISGTERSLDLVALAPIGMREFGVEMIEHGLRGAGARRQIAGDRRLHPFLALGRELLFLRLAPGLLADEIGPQPRNRLLLPMGLDLFGRAIPCRIIRGRVITQPVGHCLNEEWAFAVARGRDRSLGGGAHRDDVIAVHLFAGEAGSDRLLGERRRCGLQSERDRDGPLIVVGDEHDRKLPNAGEIHRFPQIALGGGAVTEQAHRDARLLSEPECIGNPGGVRRLRSHRNA